MSETRQQKARRLVDEGHAHIILTTSAHILATVKDEQEICKLALYADGLFFCDCEWGQTHSHTTDLCAHALAARMVIEKRETR